MIGRRQGSLPHPHRAYKRGVSAFERAGTLLPPGPPQQEPQQVEHKHGRLGEGAEEGLVVLLLPENVLRPSGREDEDISSAS